MREGETKEDAFKRLATNRTNRILKDLSLLGNLSNRNNYSYNEKQVNKIFSVIEEDLRAAKVGFISRFRKERKLNLE